MENEGFTVFESEWWHFDYRDWREYPILNVPFDADRQVGLSSRGTSMGRGPEGSAWIADSSSPDRDGAPRNDREA